MKVLLGLIALALVVSYFAWIQSTAFSAEPCGVGTQLIGDPPTECQQMGERKKGGH